MASQSTHLASEQVALFTLMAQLAVGAVLSTMLVRFPWFRRILLTEKRDWPERLIFAASLGLPLTLGVVWRLVLGNNGADLTLSGAFLAGLLAGPYAGAIVAMMLGIPPLFVGEWGALPFAIGCGFAGGGLRELCPKEAIWHFSPLFFTGLHRHVWRLVRRFEIDWVVILLAAPIGLSVIQQAVGYRWPQRLYVIPAHTPGMWFAVLMCTVLSVAIPIKIWNSARIEHRLQEQEKLLMESRLDALSSQINPHFLFNTLNSVSSLVRFDPDTARELIIKLATILRRLLHATDAFVPLRDELEFIDNYLDIEVVRFGRDKLRVVKELDSNSLDVMVPSMLLQPLVENSIKHGLASRVEGGSVFLRSQLVNSSLVIEVEDDGVGMASAQFLERPTGLGGNGIGMANVAERLKVLYGDTARMTVDSHEGKGTLVRLRLPVLETAGAFPPILYEPTTRR